MFYEIEIDEEKYFLNLNKLICVKFRKLTYCDKFSLTFVFDDDIEIFDSEDGNRLFYHYCKIKELLSNRISE